MQTTQHAPAGGQATEQSPAPRRRGRPRRPETDRQIVDAAAALLTEKGFDGMTVDEVAAKAGVGKATVYRRWPTKQDLAVAAMENIYSVEFPEPDTGSIVTDLKQGFLDAVAFANSPGGETFIRMMLTESLRDERIAALYRESSDRREEVSRASLRKAVERGEVRPDADIEHALSWISGIIVARTVARRPMPTEADVDAMVRFVLRGIMADPGSF